MIGYKQEWSGGRLVQMDPKSTSWTCPICGHVFTDNTKIQALFLCSKYGYSANANYVGGLRN